MSNNNYNKIMLLFDLCDHIKNIIYLIYDFFFKCYQSLCEIIRGEEIFYGSNFDLINNYKNNIIDENIIIDRKNNSHLQTKNFFDTKIIDLAISDATRIVKNIIDNYKNSKKVKIIYESDNNNQNFINSESNLEDSDLNNDNVIDNYNDNNINDNRLNKIDSDESNGIVDYNYLNVIKKKMYKSELPNILNDFDNDEINNLVNELLESIINIGKKLQINDNKLFSNYFKILLSNEINFNDDLNNVQNNYYNNITEDIYDDNNFDNDNFDDDNTNEKKINKNKLDYNKSDNDESDNDESDNDEYDNDESYNDLNNFITPIYKKWDSY